MMKIDDLKERMLDKLNLNVDYLNIDENSML
jgi:hypothetical protein